MILFQFKTQVGSFFSKWSDVVWYHVSPPSVHMSMFFCYVVWEMDKNWIDCFIGLNIVAAGFFISVIYYPLHNAQCILGTKYLMIFHNLLSADRHIHFAIMLNWTYIIAVLQRRKEQNNTLKMNFSHTQKQLRYSNNFGWELANDYHHWLHSAVYQ